jgi:hypothetical protein
MTACGPGAAGASAGASNPAATVINAIVCTMVIAIDLAAFTVNLLGKARPVHVMGSLAESINAVRDLSLLVLHS